MFWTHCPKTGSQSLSKFGVYETASKKIIDGKIWETNKAFSKCHLSAILRRGFQWCFENFAPRLTLKIYPNLELMRQLVSDELCCIRYDVYWQWNELWVMDRGTFEVSLWKFGRWLEGLWRVSHSIVTSKDDTLEVILWLPKGHRVR